MKKIVIAFDHRGEDLANFIKSYLEKNDYTVCMGTSTNGDDYIDNALPAIKHVKEGMADYAILICGTGVGMAMVANRFDGIYAVHAKDPAEAHFARRHENSNVLVLGAGYSDDFYEVKLSCDKTKKIINAFLSSTFEGGRHERRVNKIDKIGKNKWGK